MKPFTLNPTLQRRGALKLALAALLSLSALSGCVIQDDKPSAPKGRLQLIHANPEEGSIEVLFDEEVLLTVAPGQISEVVTLPQGELVLSLRKPGAMSTYFTTEAIDFGDELNVLVLSSEDEVIYLTDDAPMAEEDTHYVRVLDLSSSDRGVRMYRGLTEIIELPLEDQLSAFLSTEPSEDDEAYSLTDIESGGPLYQSPERVSSPAGGATLVVVQEGSGEEGDYKLTTLSLR